MPILETDIKLMASERMHDEDDGGGRMSGVEIVDGESNNIFPDVSQLDRTYGRLNLRKCFPAVIEDDVDTYFGSHLIVSRPPSDETVRVTLFRTGAAADAWVAERLDAQDKIESYVTIGPLSAMRLVGDLYEGQRAVLAYQLTTDPLPAVGEVYVLNYAAESRRQYIRVTSVSDREVTYHDSQGDFIRTELTLEISDPLRYDFPGGTPSRLSSYQPPTTLCRANTIPAVAYFGIQPLAAPAGIGTYQVKVADYKEKLLPATQSEQALVDRAAANSRIHTVNAGSREVEIVQIGATSALAVTSANRGYTYVAQLTPKPAPGTLEIAYRAQEKWQRLYDDEGTGQLSGAGAGTINYVTGSVSLTLTEMPDVDTDIIFAWGSSDHFVVDANRAVEPAAYVHTVANPPIAKSSVTVAWTLDGENKALTDDGDGALAGDGSGSVDYAAGIISFTPAVLPAADEAPAVTYRQGGLAADGYTGITRNENFSAVTVDANGNAAVTLADVPIKGSLRVSYYTRVDDAPSALANSALLWPDTYKVRSGSDYRTAAGGILASFYDRDSSPGLQGEALIVLTDPAAGGLPHGAIDYASKTLTVNVRIPVDLTAPLSGSSVPAWQTIRRETAISLVDISVAYSVEDMGGTTIDGDQYSETIPARQTVIDFTPHAWELVVPGSLAFSLAGHDYIDIEGVIHQDPDPVTGVGTPAGSIDYETGKATLAAWASGGAAAVTVTSLLLAIAPWSAVEITGFTAVAPVRPASLTVAATTLDGELLTAAAAADGVITGDSISGTVDVDNGIFDLRFGDLVADSSLSAEEKAEPWYDSADVDADGNIFRPRPVWPGTVRYNAVAYVYLPLSQEILGIDPVRLPLDGRVPIYRVGDIVVIHHTRETGVASPNNGDVIDLGRVRISWAKVYDANSDPVATGRYSVDLDAGKVTLTDVSGLALPLLIRDRIEDMALVNEVEINGALTLTRALSHDFPAGSFVSSALILSDMFARVAGVFEQETWTGAWSDELIGSAPLASFNNTVYPIATTNAGATQERWAIIFTSSTDFKVVGEFSGQVAVGDVNTDCAPLNPATGKPYFTIPAPGWGTGWATGNVLRFNTIAANRPVWVARTILQSETASGEDKFCIEVRGDVDTP